MKRALCGLLMALASHTALGEEIVTPAEPFTGWSWYNEPKKPPEQPRKPQQPAPQAIPDLSKMSPMEQARVLKGYTQEALNRAILYPGKYGDVPALAEVLDGPGIDVQPVLCGSAAEPS